jgi:ABC-type oligopeptide transport system substrate-binding subunit
MSSRKAILTTAASVFTALVLTACSESSTSGTTSDATISAQPANEDPTNRYSYSEPENTGETAQPAAAQLPPSTQPSSK